MKGGLYKMAIILSVSIDSAQKSFLDELSLSPSALLQRTINDLMVNSSISNKEVRAIQERVKLLQQTIQKQGDFIQNSGLMPEYIKVC
jgi:hypothetical protein